MDGWNLFAYFLLIGVLFIASASGQETSPRTEQRSQNKSEGDLDGKFDVIENLTQHNNGFGNDSIEFSTFPAELSNTTKIHIELRVRPESKDRQKRSRERMGNSESFTENLNGRNEKMVRVNSPPHVQNALVTGPRNVEPFSYITLALQYIPTLCFEAKVENRGRKCVTDDKWTIHGLWPTKIGGVLKNCYTPKKLGGEEFKQLEAELKKKWINIFVVHDRTPYYVNPYKFWNEQWEKHGTCAANTKSKKLNTYDKYFDETIKLFDLYNIREVDLNGPSRTLNNYIRAIKKHFKFKEELQILVTCYNRNKISYVKQVEICFNIVDDEFIPRDCVKKPPARYACSSSNSIEIQIPIWKDLRRLLPK